MSVVTDMEIELLAQGLTPGTPKYEREMRRLKVERCKEMQAVGSCWECAAFDHCTLIKQHLVDMRTP